MISLGKLDYYAKAGQKEALAGIGVNTTERITSFENFSLQIDAHALHVVEDRPVSNAYSYFIDKGNIYTDKQRKTKLAVDPEERGGLSLYGTQEAIKNSLLHPGQVVFLYSPPGQVSFEGETKYDMVKPYPDGQLYLLVGKNEKEIEAIAISVSKEQERQVLSTFFGEENMVHGGFDDERQKITYYLTHPIVTDFDIDSLLSYLEDSSHLNNFLVYKNVHNKKFFLSNIAHNLYKGWVRKIRPEIEIDYLSAFEMAKKEGVGKAYSDHVIKGYFPIYAKDGKMALGGGCGGNDGDENNPLKDLIRTDPLSTNYRLKTPSIEDIMKKNNDDSDEYGPLEFSCPICDGEHKRDPHVLLEFCPAKTNEKKEKIPIPKC